VVDGFSGICFESRLRVIDLLMMISLWFYPLLALAFVLLPTQSWIKPLPILLLLSRVVSQEAGPILSLVRPYLTAALLLSATGDVLLEFPNDRFFVQGLASFLLAHVAYVLAFCQQVEFTSYALVPWLATAVLATLLLPRLLVSLQGSPLQVPVLLYIAVILVMNVTAALVSPFSSQLCLGTLVFMVSDATIAWHKFIQVVPHRNTVVMTTYYVAQWCMVTAFLE